MQAASQGTQPTTPSSRDHWPALVSPLPWSLWAWLTMEEGQMAWLWAPGRGLSLVWDATVVDTFAQGHCIKTLPDRLVLRPQKLRPQNTKNIMTSKAITTYNQWQLRPLVCYCMASPLPLWLFWVVLQRGLLMCLVTPGSANGSTSICRWLWSREMLPAYWPVCEFDLTLRVLFLVGAFNVLITIASLPTTCPCIKV